MFSARVFFLVVIGVTSQENRRGLSEGLGHAFTVPKMFLPSLAPWALEAGGGDGVYLPAGSGLPSGVTGERLGSTSTSPIGLWRFDRQGDERGGMHVGLEVRSSCT